MTATPTGTVTFLFTDIEGSTRLLVRAEGAAASLDDLRQRARDERRAIQALTEVGTASPRGRPMERRGDGTDTR